MRTIPTPASSSPRRGSSTGGPQFVPVTEEHPLVPVDVNGINLIAGERYHLLYNDVYGIRAVSLRLTNTYGPHLLMKHDRQGFITTFIRLALEGKTIRVFGDGSQLRDFTYVSDAVDAFLAVGITEATYGRRSTSAAPARVPARGGADSARSSAARAAPWRPCPGRPTAKKIDIGSIYVDHTRLTEATGWEPQVGLRDGLAETFAFYREHGEHYRS